MWQYTYSNELYHYGKKGMRWGHRKGPQEPTGVQKKSKKKVSASNKQKVSKGKETAKKVLKGTGKAVGIGALVAGTAALAVAGSFQLGMHIVKEFVDAF